MSFSFFMPVGFADILRQIHWWFLQNLTVFYDSLAEYELWQITEICKFLKATELILHVVVILILPRFSAEVV